MANKRKRGNGEGSVFQRTDSNGKVIGWRGQQYIGNKRKSYSGKSKQQVIDEMALDRADFNRGVYVPDDDTTVGQWVEYWLEHKKKPYVKEQTFGYILYHFNNYILPHLKNVKLQELTPALIEDTYNKAFVVGKKADGSSYSDSTIKQASSYFNRCLKDAVASGKLVTNPHDNVKRPKGVSAKAINAYSPEDQQKIVDYCKNSSSLYDGIFYVLIGTGMRVGECIVLTWDDVDLRKQTISINKTFVKFGGTTFVQNSPKTSKGNREISISKNITDYLKKKKQATDQERNIRNLVFPNSKYKTMFESDLRNRFQKICAILNIEYYGMHSLRHTWATRCLEKNIPVKVVSEMLGHEDVSTTMNTYQSVLRNQQEEVANILNDLF